jgi:hypothetical protein
MAGVHCSPSAFEGPFLHVPGALPCVNGVRGGGSPNDQTITRRLRWRVNEPVRSDLPAAPINCRTGSGSRGRWAAGVFVALGP